MKNLIFIFFAVLTLSSTSEAQLAGQNCKRFQNFEGNTAYGHFFTWNNGCLGYVTPWVKPDQVYREYYMDEGGRLMIFDSVNGPYETSTATRSYFFFPRLDVPKLYATPQGQVVVEMVNGSKIVFNSQTTRIESFPDAVYKESESIKLDGTGLDITGYNNVYLDCGTRRGGLSYRLPQGQCTFYDSQRNSCTVINTEIFSYREILYEEPIFIYQTEEDLRSFLRGRCSTLNLP